MKLASCIIALTLCAGAARAQPAPPPSVVVSPGGALLNVTAEGRSERKPDLASFTAGVVTQARTAAQATSGNNIRMTAVVDALKRGGVAERDIQTSIISLQPQYYYPQPTRPVRQPDGTVNSEPAEPQAPRVIGYEARNTITVRMRRIDDMGKIIDTLVSAGANQVEGPYFSVEKPESAADEARADALRTARRRADLYAREGGFGQARIVSITEGGGYYPVSQQIVVTGSLGRGAAAPPPPPPPPAPVQAGEVTIGVSLSVQFALER